MSYLSIFRATGTAPIGVAQTVRIRDHSLSTAAAPRLLPPRLRARKIAHVQPKEEGLIDEQTASPVVRRPQVRAPSTAVAALGLGAAACSSTSANAYVRRQGDHQHRLRAAAGAEFPVQHKEWLEDVATFQKANPTITIKSVYNYPCEAPGHLHRACCGPEPSRTSSTPTSLTCRRC